MIPEQSDLSWSFRWQRDDVTEVALSYSFDRREWQQRCRHDRAGWTDPIVVNLRQPADEDDAQRIAEEYAAESV